MRRPGLLTAIIAGLVVVLILAVLVGFAAAAKGRDTIFPNVIVAGTDVGGMTADEASDALVSVGYTEQSAKVAGTVRYPGGRELVVTGEQAGLIPDPDEAAKLAYEYGRDGSFFSNGITLLRATFGKHSIEPDVAGIDIKAVKDQVAAFTKEYNEMLSKDAYTISDASIAIVKGAGSALASSEDVYALMESALHESLEANAPVSVDYELSSGSAKELDIQALYDTVFVEKKNAEYDGETGGVKDSVVGVSFDINAARNALKKAELGETVTIPLIKTEPEVTGEKLKDMLFRDTLSECTTYIHGTWNRWNNINLASAAMNGTVLNPGDTFSFNEVVGERTYDKGYADATAYIGGKSVPDVGGGICQVSSTLYACVLYADLEEIERSNHMFEVEYHMLGIDATVAWPDCDYKFKNNTDYPIKVESYVDGDYITVRLYGTKTTDNYIKLDYTVVSVTNFETIKKEDASVPEGTTKVDSYGHTGYIVDTYRYLYNGDDELISQNLIARNIYDKCDYVVLVPVGSLDPSPSPSESPSPSPSEEPSPSPSEEPSPSPSEEPSPSPSEEPSPSPAE